MHSGRAGGWLMVENRLLVLSKVHHGKRGVEGPYGSPLVSPGKRCAVPACCARSAPHHFLQEAFIKKLFHL
jgi:hypothetical protein